MKAKYGSTSSHKKTRRCLHRKVCSLHHATGFFSAVTATQAPERGGREDFQLSGIRNLDMSEGNSCMHAFAKGMDSMPSPAVRLGKGCECRERD